MTTIDTTTENEAEEPAEGPESAQDTTGAESATEPQPDDDPRGNREAAKYRRQLREVEAERDAAVALVDPARREVLANALRTTQHVTTGSWQFTVDGKNQEAKSRTLHGYLVPEAIDDAGIDVASLFDGMTLNEQRLQEELARVFAEKPYLFRAGALVVPSEGSAPEKSAPPRSFESAFRPKPPSHRAG